MGDKRTVYSVSDGEYSDYRVHWLFEDRDDANATATRVGGYVEEYDLYGPGSGAEISVYRRWGASAQVNPGGRVDDTVHCYSIESFSTEEPEVPTIRKIPHQRWYVPDGARHEGDSYEVRAWANSEDAARKAARERAAKVAAALAEGVSPDLTW